MATREFNFKKFESGKPLIPQLSAERLNGILDAISRSWPIPGDNMTGQATPGGVILRAGAKGSSSSNSFPFKATTNPEGTAVTFQVGSVLGVVPKISGVSLDNDPPPTLAFSVDGMALLRVDVTSLSEEYRPLISSLTIVKQNGTEIKDDDNDPLGELTMIWDDENIKDVGYFYIKIAFVKCVVSPPPETPPISSIQQFLNKIIYSFVIVVDDVVITCS